MIRIAKNPKPNVLVQNDLAWSAEYQHALANPPVTDAVRYRYRHTEVKQALRDEASKKCIYCETKSSPGEIDHIEPVLHRPDLIVTWENLGFACSNCNTNKGSYYSPAEPLLNPFNDEPSEALLFFGNMVRPKVGNQIGFRTVQRIRLDRMDLIERRKERIEQLQGLLEQWNALPEGKTKDIAKEKILEEAGSDREYSAMVRAFLYQQLGWEIPTAPPQNDA